MTVRTRIVAALTCVLATGLAAAPARAAFHLETAAVSVTRADGSFDRQAGGHPNVTVDLGFPHRTSADGSGSFPDGSVRDVDVDLPKGFVGNPTAAPTCTFAQLTDESVSGGGRCPVSAQIGVARISQQVGVAPADSSVEVPVYNMAHGDDVPGLFAFRYVGAVVRIAPRVRADDYGISALTGVISTAAPTYGVKLTLWGVPADVAHDAERYDPYAEQQGLPPFGHPSPDAPKPFLTSPTSCPGSPAATTIAADAWEAPGAFDRRTLTTDADGTPLVTTGCDRLPFAPAIDVTPESRRADAPTGLDVDLTVPQSDAPGALASAHVRKTVVTLPAGMSVSPSSAAGLGACAQSGIGLGTDAAVDCPDSSRIGTVDIDTPLLDAPLTGDVILAAPNDNPSNTLLALYLVAKGPGFVLKLPGRIDADAATGQLTATFDNTPQLPFSRLQVHFRGGPQAPLATPPVCGDYATKTTITSWASDTPVVLETPMKIDDGCGGQPFAPSVSAGVQSQAAGGSSPFTLTFTRADGTQYLSRIDATLPPGLLARIGSVPLCPEANAADGSCPYASVVGSTSVLSGPGPEPLPLSGRVYLTGPYGGAPFGLSIVVPTKGQAGPYDLGNVVVRAAIFVDRTDAHVTVRSDPLPRILKGFPLRLRQVVVSIDRPGFMLNPTSCAPATVTTGLESTAGQSLLVGSSFQMLGCADLGVKQKLALTFTGGKTRGGDHPGVQARVTSPAVTANLQKVQVKLPLSVALDPENAEALCTPEQRAALACPATSIVGHAYAQSVLPDPLSGPVYFVEGRRTSSTGRVIKTLPKLWIPLSADGVTIDLNADSAVDSLNRLVTTFDNIPDAPISSFDLNIDGGAHGIIAVTGSKGAPGTCAKDPTIDSQFTGHNGVTVQNAVDAKVDGCKPQLVSSSSTARSVTLRVTGLKAGSLSLSGAGVARASRTIKAADTASITAKLTKKSRSTLAHKRRLTIKLTARFTPKTGAGTSVKKTLTLKR